MKIDFASENRAKNPFDFPRLQLEQGERARIVAIETPEVGFDHSLRAPAIVNGKPIMESKKQKDGSFKDEMKMDFISNPACLGNGQKLLEDGKDPANCIICAAAQTNENIPAAKRQYIMHVIRYRLKAGDGGFTIQEPFSVELLVWRFRNQQFNRLVDIAEEHGDLRQKDLLLGPCENKGFQKFDVQPGSGAKWLETEERKEHVSKVYKENRTEDLSSMLGRKLNKDQIQNDLDKVNERYAQAYGNPVAQASAAPVSAAQSADITAALGAPAAAPAAAAPAVEETPTPEVEAAPAVETVEAGQGVAPSAAESEPAPKQDANGAMDFDSLLNGL